MIEIERKFLVKSMDFLEQATEKAVMRQGYLTKDPERTVRIRIKNQQSFITIKGKSSASGMSRFEWEKEIKHEDGIQLLALALPAVIEKTRYFVPHNQLIFEVDVFSGVHQGLILAEVELSSETEVVDLPSWIGNEVTGDQNYYNAVLANKKS
jgi:CYTH domain-containing protein